MQWIKKTLLFFSCFAWTQQLLSLSTLSLWHNINKRNNQEFLDKTPKKQKRDEGDQASTSLTKQGKFAHSKKTKCTYDGCTKEYVNPADLNNHLLLHDNPLAFQCDVDTCHMLCSNQYTLERHRKSHSSKYKCDFYNCNVMLANKFNLKKHKESHFSENNIECSLCFDRYSSLETLRGHKRVSHNPNYPFKCDICKYTYSAKKKLDKHSKIHSNKLPCLFCTSNKSHCSRYHLYKHIETQHSYYKCKDKDCDESFILGSLLLQHMEEQHGFPSMLCFECTLPFHGSLTFYQHEYIEHKKCDKNTFIKFLKDFIKKNLHSSYPSDQDHPFFYYLFLERQVLLNLFVSNLKGIALSTIPIETLLLYEEFIKKIRSKYTPFFEDLSFDAVLSYESYRLYLSGNDSAIGLLFLKDILSIMIQNRKPFETTYKEMLDILYAKDTNQFSDQEFLLFMQQFEKIFLRKENSIAEQIKIVERISSST